jgi:hypothetical protein
MAKRKIGTDERDMQEGFPPAPDFSKSGFFSSDIFRFQECSDSGVVIDDSPGLCFPDWQVNPANPIHVNYNWLQLRSDSNALLTMMSEISCIKEKITSTPAWYILGWPVPFSSSARSV